MVPIIANQVNEPNTGFDQTPRDEALRAKFGGRLVVQAVKALGRLAFAGEIRFAKSLDLHPSGQLEILDPGIKLREIAARFSMSAVQRLRQLQISPLIGSRRARRSFEIKDRIAFDVERRALIKGRQPAG